MVLEENERSDKRAPKRASTSPVGPQPFCGLGQLYLKGGGGMRIKVEEKIYEGNYRTDASQGTTDGL